MSLVNMILVHITFGVSSPGMNEFSEHDTSAHHSFVCRLQD